MKILRLEKAGSFKFWRYMVNFWTLIFFAAIIFDFFKENVLSENEVLLSIAAVYTALLAIYSAEKEFRRWHHMHASMHPGELYTIMWTILTVGLIFGGTFYMHEYKLPVEVGASYIGVIGILAITRESKNFYKRRHNKK